MAKGCMAVPWGHLLDDTKLFFIYHQKDLQIQDTHYTTYKILYDTTSTIPRGARYHVYPVALGRKKRGKGKTT